MKDQLEAIAGLSVGLLAMNSGAPASEATGYFLGQLLGLLLLFGCPVICALKGKSWLAVLPVFGSVIGVSVEIVWRHHVLTALLPWFGATVLAIICSARIAKPRSFWARRFYDERKMDIARKRFPDHT